MGNPVLTESAAHTLRTSLTPSVDYPGHIRLGYEHRGRQSVQIQIRDQTGALLYDEWHHQRDYVGLYDVTSLPPGQYRVDLNTPDAHYANTFVIGPRPVVPINITGNKPQPGTPLLTGPRLNL